MEKYEEKDLFSKFWFVYFYMQHKCFFIICIFSLIIPFEKPFPIILNIIYVVGLVFLVIMLIGFIKICIVFEKDHIYVPKWRESNRQIQHKINIKYSIIEGITLAESLRDSLGKDDACNTSNVYVILKTNRKKPTLINIHYFSKKRRIKIIDEIITRARYCGNNFTAETREEIYTKFLNDGMISPEKTDLDYYEVKEMLEKDGTKYNE